MYIDPFTIMVGLLGGVCLMLGLLLTVVIQSVRLRMARRPDRELSGSAVERVFGIVGCSEHTICGELACLELCKHDPDAALQRIETLIGALSAAPRNRSPASIEWIQSVLTEICAGEWRQKAKSQESITLLEKRALDSYAIIVPWLYGNLLMKATESCRMWATRGGGALRKQSVETLLPRLLHQHPEDRTLFDLYNEVLRWDQTPIGGDVVICALNGLHHLCDSLSSQQLYTLLQTGFEGAKLRWSSGGVFSGFGGFWAAIMHLAIQQGLGYQEKHSLAIQVSAQIRAQKMKILIDREREREYSELYNVLAHLHSRRARPRNRHVITDRSQIEVSIHYSEDSSLVINGLLLNFSVNEIQSRAGAWITGRDGPSWGSGEDRKWKPAAFRIREASGRELVFPNAHVQGPWNQDERESEFQHTFGIRVQLGKLVDLEQTTVNALRHLAEEHPVTQ